MTRPSLGSNVDNYLCTNIVKEDELLNTRFLEDRISKHTKWSNIMNKKLKIGYFADGPWSHNAF